MPGTSGNAALNLREAESQKPRPERACRVLAFMSERERQSRAGALDEAIRLTRTSNGEVASMLGVDECQVRRLRRAAKPLTDERVAALGPRLRAAYERAYSGPVQLSLFALPEVR